MLPAQFVNKPQLQRTSGRRDTPWPEPVNAAEVGRSRKKQDDRYVPDETEGWIPRHECRVPPAPLGNPAKGEAARRNRSGEPVRLHVRSSSGSNAQQTYVREEQDRIGEVRAIVFLLVSRRDAKNQRGPAGERRSSCAPDVPRV